MVAAAAASLNWYLADLIFGNPQMWFRTQPSHSDNLSSIRRFFVVRPDCVAGLRGPTRDFPHIFWCDDSKLAT